MSVFSHLGPTCRCIATVFVGVLVSSCATVPKSLPETVQNPLQWQSRQALLEARVDWSATGRIAIRKSEEGGSASYEWRQTGAQYLVNLRGPLGMGVMTLSGSDTHVELRQAGKPPYRARNADRLMIERTGWALPVEGLRYWIRGLPMPGHAEKHLLNQYDAPKQLEQDGWTISYSRYQQVEGIWLPGKLTLLNADLRVKLLVDQWQMPIQ